MTESWRDVLRDQGQGIIGALLLGTPLLVTMEAWRRGQVLPMWTLGAFAAAGLATIMLVIRVGGIRQHEQGARSVTDWVSQFAELVLHSTFAALLISYLFGVLRWGDSPDAVMRVLLIQLVPLGLGAALARNLMSEARGAEAERSGLKKEVAIFSLGAIFFSIQAAPTQETILIAAMADWFRLGALVVVSVLFAYLALYELEFRGHGKRIRDRSGFERVGRACLAYATGLVVATLLLAGYGQLSNIGFEPAVARVVALGFVATVGGAVGQVGAG